MNTHTSSLKDSPSPAVCAEAAAWVARLHGSNRSRALESGFRRWLSASPAHAQAFELATEAWEIGGNAARRSALPRVSHASSSSEKIEYRKWALAAVFGLAVVASALYVQFRDSSVVTAIGEQRMLTLEDGTRVFLNTSTRIEVQYDKQQRRVILDEGEALFDVAAAPSRPFVVAAGDSQITALGTSFVVRRDVRRLMVTLVEGKVAVSSDAAVQQGTASVQSAPRALSPGQRLTFAAGHSPKLDRPPVEEVIGWRRGEVVMDKTRLADAVEEMNRYNSVKLVIENPKAADIAVSGIFRVGDSARFAQAVAETYHLRVVDDSRQIVLSGAPIY